MAELTTECCTTDMQARCCEPGEKSSCCGDTRGTACGCASGTGGPADGQLAELRESVRKRYAAAAGAAGAGAGAECCGSSFGASLYRDAADLGGPESSINASLGCEVPTAVAELAAGETVLDLGSGAGLDVLISARRVGPTGKVIGLDMTKEMLDLRARKQVA